MAFPSVLSWVATWPLDQIRFHVSGLLHLPRPSEKEINLHLQPLFGYHLCRGVWGRLVVAAFAKRGDLESIPRTQEATRFRYHSRSLESGGGVTKKKFSNLVRLI
jgi:hypothetical protein